MYRSSLLGLVALLTGCIPLQESGRVPLQPRTHETTTSDGVPIFGYSYSKGLAREAPTILLFHQGGASARGEYSAIALWLNELGYRAIAWDLRKGGDLFEQPNQTVQSLPPEAEVEFCTAYRDVEAALIYAVEELGIKRIAALGSSYSGSLVYQLAAKHPGKVDAILAFSPASGGPVADCKADLWAGDVSAPALVLRPASEMEREPSIEQRRILERQGATFFVAMPGTHGASMLLDKRVGADAEATRIAVSTWLNAHFPVR